MCCGRGYDTSRVSRMTKCECKFHWCCAVRCQDCLEVVDIHTCKAPKSAGWISRTWCRGYRCLRTTAFALPSPCRECVRGLTLLLRHFCLCLSLHRSYWIINTNSAAFTSHFCMTVLLQSCLCVNWCSSGRTYFCRDSSNQHVTLLRTPCGN